MTAPDLFSPTGLVTTAVQTGGGTLELINWNLNVDANGNAAELVRIGSFFGDIANKISILNATNLNDPATIRAVTACRNGDGNLELIAWQLIRDGRIVQGAHATAGPISDVTMVRFDFGAQTTSPVRFATVVRTSTGFLEVIVWYLSNGTITRKGSFIGGAISKVKSVVTRFSEFSADGTADIVTIAETSSGNLDLIGWRVQDDGSISKLSEVSAGVVTEVGAVTRIPNGPTIITADASGGRLKLISWLQSITNGDQITRGQDVLDGPLTNIGISTVFNPAGGLLITTSGTSSSGSLLIKIWDLTSTGFVTLDTTSVDGLNNAVLESMNNFIVAAGRDNSGNLRLIDWTYPGM